jgi:hypothetical protein
LKSLKPVLGQGLALQESMRHLILLPVAFLLLLAAPASAQPGNTAPGQTPVYQPAPYAAPYVQQPRPATRTTNYGWHVFAADAASWVVMSAASDGDSEGLVNVASLGMMLGGPIVHLAHGNNRGAGYSLLARTALPLGGGLLGAAACDDDDGFDCLGKIGVGVILGYGGALAIDWFHLAEKTETVAPPTGWASLRPSLKLSPKGAQAGLGMTF